MFIPVYICWFFTKDIKILILLIFINIRANQHLEAVNLNVLYILLVTIIMEHKQAANYNNLLLDNLNMLIPVDITLSTTLKLLSNSTLSLLKTYQSEVLAKENSSMNNSHITKIEDYINKTHNQIALEHLKS